MDTTLKLLKPGIKLDDVFDHPYLLLSIFTIALAYIIFVIYKYYISTNTLTVQPNYTYFSKNPVSDPPVFSEPISDAIACQNRCIADPLCDGITYDSVNSLCIGSKNAALLPATSEYSAWIKPATDRDPFISKTIIASYAASPVAIKTVSIPAPSILGQFTYSLWLNISDWYGNYQYWKHVAHKGTFQNSISCKEWSDVIKLVPDQCIGLWLAPYTNNLRIAITTETLSSPEFPIYTNGNIMKCVSNPNVGGVSSYLITDNTINIASDLHSTTFIKSIEFVDIQNIPINKLYHVAIVQDGQMLNVYVNGGLLVSKLLKGTPIFNTGAMYVKFDTSFTGQVVELAYVPLISTAASIAKFYSAKPLVDIAT